MEKEIGGIYNQYGRLTVRENNGKYQWSIEDYCGHDWEDIPKSLYDELIKFEESREDD